MGRKTYDRKRIDNAIIENAGKISVRAIAELVGVTPSTISKYASRLCVSLQTQSYKKRIANSKKNKKGKPGYFNVNKYSNWLV